ncbi:ATP-dependent DNA helicase [Mycolicibacterium fallax]|jgi:superfamily I DNA/RNA helicase/RecB family exonuclease|uniref:DNA 3'-5' helicase n=3 Tax=Mycolicibacterium fallax TaxID=1793 RepID=A0A1X1REN1_MYCFA|nr:ATP-dependent DNA helicase [Mycolicibacterium fallax]ORV04218.1 ATP-dependent DNA helicase [Mycolicibacterium fallax]BBY98388.1 DNA helicase [Mycolicibacterium fallax]HOW93427.1 ATP-dependent DNA helicase [Mycolicibacterium fallax]
MTISYAAELPGGAAALHDARGIVRVLGGPGTGKSALLIGLAADRIAAGADPESVLLLTGAGRPAAATRAALTTALLTTGVGTPAESAVVREPLVRTAHSYAFALLARAAQRAGDPPPRLITGTEQDGIIRELLAGDQADGAEHWPPPLRPALGTAAFATELRDLLARCAERGLDGTDLRRLGTRMRRPEWAAAGRFAQQYEQVMLLRAAVGMAAPQATVPALGAAEMIGAAADALLTDPDLLAAERARLSVLLVDDAQHLDPQAVRLVRLLAPGPALTVIAGDPNQAAFGFRGASPELLLDDADGPALELHDSHRCAPAVAAAITAVAAGLPGAGPARRIDGAAAPAADTAEPDPGRVRALLAGSPHAEAAAIADALRRAHLIGGTPWSQMAVIVRSVSRVGAALTRTLTAAGVPVAPGRSRPPLAENPTVRALLTVLGAADDGLTGEDALALLSGPLGRLDPVTLRQLRRALRRLDGAAPPLGFGELVVAALAGPVPDGLAGPHARPLQRLKKVLDAAAAAGSDDPRRGLWQAWQRSGLQARLLAAIERGGPGAARAEADLDAVTELFDIADQFVDRSPGATPATLVDHVRGLTLPITATEPIEAPDAVTVLSPQQSLGAEWDVVVIAGLQEGLWPNTIPRGGVLGTQGLLDLLDGVTGTVSVRAPLVADERRLLLTAMGRARRTLIVTAVDAETGGSGDGVELPSAFFHEIARLAIPGDPGGPGPGPDQAPAPLIAPAVLSESSVVGRLRAAVCAPDGAIEDADRFAAASQLARLAAAGVPGADPAHWYGLAPVSTDAPVFAADAVVGMSPSVLQTVTDCPLRWLAERHGGADPRDLPSALGTLVHALIADGHRGPEALANELEKLWEQLPFGSPWHARNELRRHLAMLEAFHDWRARTRGELTEVGTELAVTGALDERVAVRGRADRVERDEAGRLVIVDIKTGRSPVSKADAAAHAQLAMYQLAVAEGLLGAEETPGGARLVYLAKTGRDGATVREQDPLTEQTRADWRQRIDAAAADMAGPAYTARRNTGCGNCPMRAGCPAHRDPGSRR